MQLGNGNVFVNAPFFIVDPSTQRSGWTSLVVTQPSTGHQLLCVQCVSVCTVENLFDFDLRPVRICDSLRNLRIV